MAVDINDYLLAEAELLAQDEGLDATIAFQPGNAEHLPFDDGSFDVVFTTLVLEECDADAAIGELYRVLTPGERAAVVVRSHDLPPYWHVDVDGRAPREADAPHAAVCRGARDL